MDVKNHDTRPISLPIKKIIKETDTIWTFVFEYELGSLPGQFVMLWIPGVDEKPFSVAFDDGNEFWLTICNVGPSTDELFKLKEGDKIGIRGPFGTAYEFKPGDHLALVSGGYGAAPMYNVAHEAVKAGCKVEFLTGARNKGLLLYGQRILNLDDTDLHVSTDDGSAGHKGFITEVLKQVLENEKIDKVFTCGPEVMMEAVCNIADEAGVAAFLSVEKYMKCGFGVCGQCSIDDTGVLACKKGPVMDWDKVKDLPEFGKYHRDAQGKKHNF